MDTTSTIAPAPEVLAHERSGEVVLLSLKTGRFFGLDTVGTRIWQMLTEGHSLDTIHSRLLQDYDVARDKLLADVGAFVAALESHELVVRVPARG